MQKEGQGAGQTSSGGGTGGTVILALRAQARLTVLTTWALPHAQAIGKKGGINTRGAGVYSIVAGLAGGSAPHTLHATVISNFSIGALRQALIGDCVVVITSDAGSTVGFQ